jgi:phage/plasmid-like protein (TIGR03299 family)
MPAEVETMFYTGKEPWHGLGTKLDNPATAAEAIVAAGLDWKVGKRKVFAGDDVTNEYHPCIDNVAIVRMDDNKVLGVVGRYYEPIQNHDAFDFFDSVVKSGAAIYHTAGSLKGGKRIWILAHLPGDLTVTERDIIQRYILLSSSHDGKTTLRMFFTPIRVVCMNTLNWAMQRAENDGITIRHTGNLTEKIQQARDALQLTEKYYQRFAEVSSKLVETKADDAFIDAVLRDCFPNAFLPTPTTRSVNIVDEIKHIINGGTKTATVPGTVWNLVNAVAEYVDHGRVVKNVDDKSDNRLTNIWFTGGRIIKQQAFSKALAMIS